MKSHDMHLSAAERRWLPWWGRNGKLALGWSCLINRAMYPVVEKIFDGIANSRRNHILLWVNTQWDLLAALAAQLGPATPAQRTQQIGAWLARAPDFSELFVIDTQGRVLCSTHAARVGRSDLDARAVAAGLRGPFLHGPYSDAATLAIGASTSKFHDAVTLMFYQPLLQDGAVVGCLCGRVPNDVLSDIIQREAGHGYRD